MHHQAMHQQAMHVERRRLRVRGTVQGVGFRPFVYRRAVSLGLAGWVGNDARGVVIEAEGTPRALEELTRALREDPPPLAVVDSVEVVALVPQAARGFTIAPTAAEGGVDVAVSADVAPCAACLRELADPRDRRHDYPFINCTDCGPRYTIIRRVPYDRPSTTMAGFVMCTRCQAEYDDPADRRFHAQPNACPACGPRLAWSGPGALTGIIGAAALDAAVACLQAGGIVAVKGVGGYHLACAADDAVAVDLLRRRKQRDDKPFAVMVADLEVAGTLCRLDATGRALLTSPRRPVVLAVRCPDAPVADQVAPGAPELGVMLPSSPLHHLLARRAGGPLVMTSGNRSDEPVAHDDADASRRLQPLVDGTLGHDRTIHVRADDSVVRVSPAGRPQVLRRARGYVPQPLRLPVAAEEAVLAVGAELKSTVAVARRRAVVASAHLGDLEHWATYQAFLQAVEHLPASSGVTPAVVAHDLHPEYLSTKWAMEQELPRVAVQHHHAHVASCLVEHGRSGPVLGLAFDGLGLGDDGTLWGGEFLLADLAGYRRVGHLRTVALPGGAAAVREPWRMALAWLHRGLGAESAAEHGPALDPRWRPLVSLIASGRAPETSSVGRLFDAVAALVGFRSPVTYEGQAAMQLEALARTVPAGQAPVYPTREEGGRLDPEPMLAAVVADLRRGVPAPLVAAGFHAGLAAGAAGVAVSLASAHGVDTVVLSGGVFANVVLSDLLAQRLQRAGLEVLQHEQLPPNDGSISVGQAAVAAASTIGTRRSDVAAVLPAHLEEGAADLPQ